MRGKGFTQKNRSNRNRITPAYAGKRKILAENGTGGRDHPRLCGEKADENVKSWLSRGITPAYAGKSQSKGNAACVRKDHPRLCGEKLPGGRTTSKNMGSPPPMRGKAFWGIHAVICQGITPAYAGKSVFSNDADPLSLDHPRLCGEKFKIAFVLFALSGSPPPMRGKGFL